MTITDFIFDETSLSSLNYIIADLNASSGTRQSINSTRSFSYVSMFNGKFMPFTAVKYPDRLEFTFDIIKDTCNGYDNFVISTEEERYLMRWLARPSAKKFKLVHSDYQNIYYEGSFNVTEIFNGDDRIGLRLTFTTNRPFGMHEAILFKKTFESSDDALEIVDISDDAGFIYPYIEIVCNENGNLCLSNSYDNRDTIINGCKKGERIIITENLVIASDDVRHKIQDEFNYEFLKISNNYRDRTNKITSTLKCDLLISYCPIAKVVF